MAHGDATVAGLKAAGISRKITASRLMKTIPIRGRIGDASMTTTRLLSVPVRWPASQLISKMQKSSYKRVL